MPVSAMTRRLAQVAGEHGGAPHGGRRALGRLRDRIQQHSLERAGAQLAEDDA